MGLKGSKPNFFNPQITYAPKGKKAVTYDADLISSAAFAGVLAFTCASVSTLVHNSALASGFLNCISPKKPQKYKNLFTEIKNTYNKIMGY